MKRYHIDETGMDYEADDGDFVKHEDVAALEARLTALEEWAEEYINPSGCMVYLRAHGWTYNPHSDNFHKKDWKTSAIQAMRIELKSILGGAK